MLENIELCETISSLGVQPGDILLVSSNIMKLIRTAGKQDVSNFLINLLQNTVSGEGTLLFPTYNWDFCQGKPFNYHKTPSMTGSLSRIA
jgi:aminoglycoside 3-N-acetyltransferase